MIFNVKDEDAVSLYLARTLGNGQAGTYKRPLYKSNIGTKKVSSIF